MPLNLEQKRSVIKEVNAIAISASSAVISDYRGLTVSDINKLRSKARENNVYLRVVRNTLARRAVVDTEFDCLTEALTGSVILAFSLDEPCAAARLIRDFLKEYNSLDVKVLALRGKLLLASDLEVVANLPSRKEAIAILMRTMKSPITQFVRTLVEPCSKLVRTIAAIRDEKQVT